MAQARWQATVDGRYFIDAVMGNYNLQAMVDLGLVDPLDRIGFELEPSFYDQLVQSGWLFKTGTRQSRNASGQYSTTSYGLTKAQLLDPVSGQPIGPIVQLYVSRGKPALASRVGLVFFHRLKGCRVIWDLDSRTWCVEYP